MRHNFFIKNYCLCSEALSRVFEYPLVKLIRLLRSPQDAIVLEMITSVRGISYCSTIRQ